MVEVVAEEAGVSSAQLVLDPIICPGRRLLLAASWRGFVITMFYAAGQPAPASVAFTNEMLDTIGNVMTDSVLLSKNYDLTAKLSSTASSAGATYNQDFESPVAPTPQPTISWQSRFLFWYY
jgi:hypothetical protein